MQQHSILTEGSPLPVEQIVPTRPPSYLPPHPVDDWFPKYMEWWCEEVRRSSIWELVENPRGGSYMRSGAAR